MSHPEPSGPDLDGVVADANAVGLPYEITATEHLRVRSRHGIVDLLRGGAPPLDFGTVAALAIKGEVGGETAEFASLRSIVGFKRLAGRPQDRRDLEELEAPPRPASERRDPRPRLLTRQSYPTATS
jgi:hypothetical protein